MRVGYYRRRAAACNQPCILTGHQERGFDVDVSVYQSGNNIRTPEIIFLYPPVIPDPQYNPVADGEIALIPVAGKGIENPGIPEYRSCRDVSPGRFQLVPEA